MNTFNIDLPYIDICPSCIVYENPNKASLIAMANLTHCTLEVLK